MKELKRLPDHLSGIRVNATLPQPNTTQARFAELAATKAATLAPDRRTAAILNAVARLLAVHPKASEVLTAHLFALMGGASARN